MTPVDCHPGSEQLSDARCSQAVDLSNLAPFESPEPLQAPEPLHLQRTPLYHAPCSPHARCNPLADTRPVHLPDFPSKIADSRSVQPAPACGPSPARMMVPQCRSRGAIQVTPRWSGVLSFLLISPLFACCHVSSTLYTAPSAHDLAVAVSFISRSFPLVL